MNWKNILILALFVTVLFGCYDEDKIVPLEPGEGMVRYEFPQGENAWDQDIVEISEQFGVYLIYKDLKIHIYYCDLQVLCFHIHFLVFPYY